MEKTAISTPEAARRGGEFFAAPTEANQRRYEALRAYLFEGVSAAETAARFGYTAATLQSLVRDFRAGRREFFLTTRPGPKTAPAKEAARARIIELRRLGHSAHEIAAVLAEEGTPLNRTGVAEILSEEGFPRLWPRPHAERGLPRRENQPRTKVIDFDALPAHADSRMAGLLLTIPDLVALDLPGLVRAAGYPSTSVIPALSSILSLLAIKLTTTRRVSHVDDIATDAGAALFAGLTSLPKATALTTYSYRLDHARQQRFLAALDKASLTAGLAHGETINLDFHAVMHWGDEPAPEKHYVPRRSQRTRSVLTFFAEDAATHTLLYANADLAKASQNREIVAEDRPGAPRGGPFLVRSAVLAAPSTPGWGFPDSQGGKFRDRQPGGFNLLHDTAGNGPRRLTTELSIQQPSPTDATPFRALQRSSDPFPNLDQLLYSVTRNGDPICASSQKT
ncbi:helix-turn-helix domain-containing protein [Saccharopolyspora hattusasensis]|uniref:helix-turn-helix domain-containing protein n=1 Tax=Saccharopolyspora hattusasensis TaxID=1128679 RepID=UPI003D96C62E